MLEKIKDSRSLAQVMFFVFAVTYLSSLVSLAVFKEPTILDSGCPEDHVTCFYTLIHMILFMICRHLVCI